MSIRLLSSETINKIAAGEVVENPASVVKELVENALDATSQVITIEIERGGFSLIRVSDDGIGMGKEDLLLSLERHATSKIQVADDLASVLTMGFRGEALASIGAISKMKVLTAQENKAHGYAVLCEGGKISSPSVAARSPGTTIEVRSLFYNVPARLKFQKPLKISQQAITRLITKMSLAHPEKVFRYFSDGKESLHLLPGSLKERCQKLLGEPFIKEASYVDFSEGELAIKGWIGAPVYAKRNRLGQHLFVNGRAVISLQISYGIYEGYGTRLGTGLHPMYVLHVTLPPKWVDVNVHPQKREIRLGEEKQIQRAIRQAILKGFKGEEKEIFPPRKMEWHFDSSFRAKETSCAPVQTEMLDVSHEHLPVIGLFDGYLILHNTPLINLPSEEGMVIVDLEAATARILYERFLKREMAPLQTLLFPLTFELTPDETKSLLAHIEEIKAMGIDIRPFGDLALIVDALSLDIEEGKLKGLLEHLAQVFDQDLVQKDREKKLAFAASYFARSQKKGWTLVEAQQTVKLLLKTSSPYYCPKGVKTIILLSHDAIKKLFQKKNS